MDGFGWLAGAAVLGLLAWFGLRRTKGGGMIDIQTLPARAQIVDVRTPGEFRRGHAPGSVNIPLDELGRRAGELDRSRAVVLCCASGARSAAAHGLLKRAGFEQVLDAGPWTRLHREAS